MGSKKSSARKLSENMSKASGPSPDGASGADSNSPGSGANSIAQWVEKVVNYSSQYDPQSWCADCVIGPPKVYPKYGDIPGAWASKTINSTQFIELHYKQAVYIQQINIYETFNAGGVKKVQGRTDSEGEWHVLWKTNRVECIRQSRIFSPPLENHQMKFSEVRIEVDCTAAETWSEIDAVEIVGITSYLPSPPSLKELSNDLSVLVNSETFSDVHFLVDDRKLFAHRAILMARSDYFKAMFCNDMKEAKEMDVITLKDVQFDGFYALLHFTYTNKIPDYYKPEQLLEIWRVADRFSVEGLKSLVAHEVCHNLDNDNVVSIYCEATNTLPIIDDIKNSCVEYMKGRLPSVVKTKPFENLPKDIMLEIIQLTNNMKIS